MMESRQLTKTSSGELSPPSSASRASDRARSIAVLLNRLALHCPFRDLPEAQAALRMEDMIRDLLPYEPRQVAGACDAWRNGRNPWFPISGQLVELIHKAGEQSIAHRRASKPAYRAPLMLEHQRKPLKPWREILREHGKQIKEPEARGE